MAITLVGMRQVCRRLKEASQDQPLGVYVVGCESDPDTWGIFTTDIFIGVEGVTRDAMGKGAAMKFVQLVDKPLRYRELKAVLRERFPDFEF